MTTSAPLTRSRAARTAVGLVAAAVGLTGGAWVLSVAGWLAVVTLAVLVQETRGATR